MVENEEITGTMRGDGDSDLVSDFIGITPCYKDRLTIFKLNSIS